MEDFSTNNEYHFVKNLTPRLYSVDPSYKTNKPKLMRDVRLLRRFLDGKIPPVSTNDPEQLRILLTKCKKNAQQLSNSPNLFDEVDKPDDTGYFLSSSPVKLNIAQEEKEEKKVAAKSSSSESDDSKRMKRKHRKHGKKKRKKRKHRSSKSSSDDEFEMSMPFFQNTSISNPRYQLPFRFGTQNLGHDIYQSGQLSASYSPYNYFPVPFQSFSSPFRMPVVMPYQTTVGQSESATFIPNEPEKSIKAESSSAENQNQWGDFDTLVETATNAKHQ